MDPDVADVIESLRHEHGFVVDAEARTITLEEPQAEPGSAVLRVISLAAAVSPVAAAARGPKGVAVGLWNRPELHLARWTKGRLWVVAYRLPAGSKPGDYVRTEGRIPTHLETGSWYDSPPEVVSEAFFEAGVLLDDPPFPVPKAPPPVPPSPKAAVRRSAAPRAPRSAPTPRVKPPTVRLCATCGMQKALVQFAAGSEECIDCR
jgi:hypothetical protein